MATKTLLIIGGIILFLLISFFMTLYAMKNAEVVDPKDETFLK